MRTHNIEHYYYSALAEAEPKWYKKLYYRFEAYMLKNYEVVIKEANALFAISENDAKYFSKYANTILVSAFHENDVVNSKLGEGEYCLYHGNLSVPENEQAALDLIEKVFSKIERKVIIAGANPSDDLLEAIADFENIEIVANPNDSEMKALKQEAHVHVLYSAQATGAKLKLMDSLTQGRFVIANDNILINENLKSGGYTSQ